MKRLLLNVPRQLSGTLSSSGLLGFSALERCNQPCYSTKADISVKFPRGAHCEATLACRVKRQRTLDFPSAYIKNPRVSSSLIRLCVFCLVITLLLPACANLQAPIKPDLIYGAYPSNYKEIVSKWMDSFLAHPESVKDVRASKPMKAKSDERSQYDVIVQYLAKLDDGSYTPEQTVVLGIRDGQIVERVGPMLSTQFRYTRLPSEIRSRTAL